ncbi:hypothetical protein EJ110_NYTH52744 [Nymphaea thermarum]|nr:hypothetical protein EJ110_NYTH52744 [Nymphaea thermarum]
MPGGENSTPNPVSPSLDEPSHAQKQPVEEEIQTVIASEELPIALRKGVRRSSDLRPLERGEGLRLTGQSLPRRTVKQRRFWANWKPSSHDQCMTGDIVQSASPNCKEWNLSSKRGARMIDQKMLGINQRLQVICLGQCILKELLQQLVQQDHERSEQIRFTMKNSCKPLELSMENVPEIKPVAKEEQGK